MYLELCFDFQSIVGNENTIYDDVVSSPVELQKFMIIFYYLGQNRTCKM